MAKNVTISCLSSPPARIGLDPDLASTVDRLIAHWRSRLEQVLPDRPDLIVLPEMCDSPDFTEYPFDRQLDLLKYRGDVVLEFFAEVAKEHACHVAYSALRFAPDGSLRNTTQILDRSGAVAGVYDKNHVTIGEHDDRGVQYGTGLGVFDLDIGRVGCVICFDLNFDELRAAYAEARPRLLLFSSAYHGGLMQQYWAYSCRSYLAGSVSPPAPSGLISPVGEILSTSTNYRNEVTATVNLDYAVVHLDFNRSKLADLKRRYGPRVRVHDPGLLGSVLVTSETDEFTADEVVAEFELEPLDDYFARSRQHREGHLA